MISPNPKNKPRWIYQRFDLTDYQRTLIERFQKRCQWNRKRSVDLARDDTSETNEEYEGFRSEDDVIGVRAAKVEESTGASTLTCCRKLWTNDEHRQCRRCHRRFTRNDVFYGKTSNDSFCSICWQYDQWLIARKEKHRSAICYNICSNHLSSPLIDEIVALNFVHPICWQNRL